MTVSSLCFLLLLCLFSNSVSSALDPRNIQSNITARSTLLTVASQCSDGINRQWLYDTYGLGGDIPNGDSVKSALDFNTSIIESYLDGRWSDFTDQIKASAGKLFLFIGPWLIGLAITLLTLPFLLCCCICPWSCPPCGRKRQNMPFSKCEMTWPAIVSFLLLLLVIVTSIVGISYRLKADNTYQSVACASGIILDDLMNGNITFTQSYTYFSGMRNINSQIDKLSRSISILNADIKKLSSSTQSMSDIKSKISSSITSTAQIPSPSEDSLVLNYNIPFSANPSTTNSTIPSNFPFILGNKSAPLTFVGLGYESLTAYEFLVSQISKWADDYISKSESFQNSIDQVVSETFQYVQTLEKQDSKLADFWTRNKSGVKGETTTTAEYFFYGVLMALCVLMMLTIVLTVLGFRKCQYFMYTVSVILFFVSILTFIVCIVVSFVNPVIYYGCQYVQENLDLKQKLENTLRIRFSIESSIAGNLSECIALNGRGDLGENFVSTVYGSIKNLSKIYVALMNMDPLIRQVNLTHQILLNAVTARKEGAYIDISDESALNELIKLSKSSNYDCKSDGFESDSWIPSINQNIVQCNLTSASASDSSSCQSSTDFTSRGVGCVGCMDTSNIFKSNQTYIDVKAALKERYPDSSCSIFITELSNIWANFYKPKSDAIAQIETHTQTAKKNADEVSATPNYLTQIRTDIQKNLSTIFESESGFLDGLNCKVLREDLQLFKSTLCHGAFLYTYFMRVIFGIISLSLSILLCCVICTWHRNVKQKEINDPSNQSTKKENDPNSETGHEIKLPQIHQNFMLDIDSITPGNQTPHFSENPYTSTNSYNRYAYEP